MQWCGGITEWMLKLLKALKACKRQRTVTILQNNAVKSAWSCVRKGHSLWWWLMYVVKLKLGMLFRIG